MRFSYTPILVLGLALTSNALAINEQSLAARGDSLSEHCGDGPILNTTTLQTADGRDLKITVKSCGTPDSNVAREALSLAHDSVLNKRQMPSVCNQTCVQSCHFNGSAPPDCTSLISTINALDGETFIAPPGTTTIFEVGTCEVSFFHGLQQPVQGCFSWLSPLVVTMNQCFSTGPPFNEGACSQENAAFSWELLLAKRGTF